MDLRLVVFDMDGTLIDSQDVIVASMGKAFGQMGRPTPSRQDILSIVGLSLPQAIARLAPEFSDAALDEAVVRYKQAFVETRAANGGTPSPLYHGAIEVLDRLAAQDETLLGVATGKSRRGLDHVFAAHDRRRYFQTAQTADDHPSKPHPSMTETALSDTGVSAADAVMIGDTSFDMEMARAASVAGVGVSWGYHDRSALRDASCVIDAFDQLPAALAGIWD